MAKYGFDGISRTRSAEWGFANVMFLAAAAKNMVPTGRRGEGEAVPCDHDRAGEHRHHPDFLGSPAGAAAPGFPGIHRPGITILKWDGQKFVTAQDFFSGPELLPARS